MLIYFDLLIKTMVKVRSALSVHRTVYIDIWCNYHKKSIEGNMKTLDIFTFLDYRKYIADYYSLCKPQEPAFSHRSFLKKAGIPGTEYLKRVMLGMVNGKGRAGTGFTGFHRISVRFAQPISNRSMISSILASAAGSVFLCEISSSNHAMTSRMPCE